MITSPSSMETYRRCRFDELAPRILARGVRSGDCLLWPGACNPKGYGQVRHKKRLYYVHRIVWEWHNGRPPGEGLDVAHTCDTTSCCEPSHLFEATRSVNLLDMSAKGRWNGPRGATHPHATLSDEQVAEVRAMVAAGSTTRSVGAAFNISYGYVSRLARGIRRAR